MTDWQALDARIAREVMGLHIFVPISGGREWRDDEGTSHYGVIDAGHSHSPLPPWQPHKNVAQAMEAKDKIVMQEWCFDLSNRPGSLPVVYFWRFLNPMVGIQGHAETDAGAICLALEAWLDA